VREVRILKSLNHPHITRLYEVIDTPQEVFLIMEYAEGGELFDYLVGHGRMKEKDARKHFRQIISAVDFCHTRHVIHRDLKAENLLLDLDLNAKIADFGFSNNFEDGKPLSTWCGSPPYAAPELFQGKEYFGPEVDIWSLGVVLYVLVCGALPFDGSTLAALRQRVLSGKFKVPFFMSHDCEQVIKRMLTVEASQRITLEEIKQDKWFNEGFEPLGDPNEAEIIVTPQQHTAIIRRMEEIGIPRAVTEKTLESQSFDHIWATYYLIADQLTLRTPLESAPAPVSLTPSPAALVAGAAAPETANIPAPAATRTPVKRPSSGSQQPVTISISSPEGHLVTDSSPRTTSPPAADVPEKSRKVRRHTVNTQVDVIQVRKDMATKRASKIDLVTTSPPESPVTPVVAVAGSLQPSEKDSPGPAVSGDYVPIPRNKKDRRVRAISLSTQRPATVYSVASSFPSSSSSSTGSTTEEASSASSATASYSTNAPAVSSPLNPNASVSPPISRSLKFQPPPRRVSFKDRFKKTLGMPLKEESEPKEIEPKTVRFHFSVSTTSSKPANELVLEVERVLAMYTVAFERENFLFLANKANVAFEIEICKLPRLTLNGLKFKRLAGDSWAYKNLCSEMISKMRL